jgi:aldose 1-epimerase
MLHQLKQDVMTLTYTFHSLLEGKKLYSVTLKNEAMTVTLTNLGCAITGIYTPDKKGVLQNIVAGFEDPAAYRENEHYLGCIVGRYANRIAEGKFTLDGEQVQLPVNNNGNHLHGGVEGFHAKVWDLTAVIRQEEETGVLFEYTSKDGEEGYPGNLHIRVQYLLDTKNRLTIRYHAVTDQRTPVNLTNHSYFNLTGFDNPLVTDHVLQINAMNYTEKSAQNLPTGRVLPVALTPLDFTLPQKIGKGIDAFPMDKGFDHNYVLTRHAPGELVLAAELSAPETGRVLRVYTDQEAIQLYTANWWNGKLTGQQGIPYGQHGAAALETQAFPDSPNHPGFPNTILGPGEVYESVTIFEFDVQ